MAPTRLALLTIAALVAFAANSVLARLALRAGAIDPASYSSLRLATGALMLALMVHARRGRPGAAGNWTGAGLLAAYAVPFSFAYVALTTGTGALILFGTVQVTMVGAGLLLGERPPATTWVGAALAAGGIVALVLPGLEAPPPGAAALMALAGTAWGGYSLVGRRATEPLLATAGNFLRATPLALGVLAASVLASPAAGRVTPAGAALATASGALASGLGYVAWYAALPGLTRTQAALTQPAVLVLAAAAGVFLLGEPLTLRLVLSGSTILAGIGLVVLPSRRD